VADGNGEIAFNIAGGLHHAMSQGLPVLLRERSCDWNQETFKAGKRVAYIDIDAHHGDGVQKAFYDTDQVLTVSLHETGIRSFQERF